MSMIEATKNIYNKPCFGTFTRVNHLHKCGQLTLWVVWVRYILYSAAKGQLLILRHLEQVFLYNNTIYGSNVQLCWAVLCETKVL